MRRRATGQKHVHRQSSSSHSHCFTIIQGLWVHFVFALIIDQLAKSSDLKQISDRRVWSRHIQHVSHVA